MPFEINACSIDDIHRHPIFLDRTLARVKVTLREIRSREIFDHDLTFKVWATTDEKMTPAGVKAVLLTRAAAILKRTVSVAEIKMSDDGKYYRATNSG